MNLADAIPPDDLLLARLVCSKLVNVLDGIVSVGVASLELDSPTDFLAGKDRLILGFLEVLRCIGVRPGHADKVEQLRHPVHRLTELATQFHGRFMELARWRGMAPEAVRDTAGRLSQASTDFVRSLGAFCSLLGMGPECCGKAQQGISRVDDFLQVLKGMGVVHEP
jgi:hypothetical protein